MLRLQTPAHWIALLVAGLSASAGVAAPASGSKAAARAPAPPGVTITMRDGKCVTAASVRRDGNNVMATVSLNLAGSAAAAPSLAQIGYPVASIAKIDFPEPSQIKAARESLARGKADDALAQIEPVVGFYQPFRDVPGNWWAPSALLKLNALVALHRDRNAEGVIAQLSQAGNDPEAALAARVQLAAGWARKGDSVKAIPVFDAAIKQARASETLAQAWIAKGDALLGGKEFANALRAYLHVPVFYPDQKLAMPTALLGSARAYLAIEDSTNARNALGDLTLHFPASPEAAIAKDELKKLETANTGKPINP